MTRTLLVSRPETTDDGTLLLDLTITDGHKRDEYAVFVDVDDMGVVCHMNHKADAKRSYRLTCSPTGAFQFCSCPDWRYRGAKTGVPCRHGASLVKLIEIGTVQLPKPQGA